MIELPYKMTKIASSSGLVIMRQISNQYNIKISIFNPKLISFMQRQTLNISLTVLLIFSIEMYLFVMLFFFVLSSVVCL